MLTERFGQLHFRPAETWEITMYVEREQDGGFSKASINSGASRPAGEIITVAKTEPATSGGALENRTEQVPAERPALRFPAPVAEAAAPAKAPARTRKFGRRALIGAALLLAVGAAGDF